MKNLSTFRRSINNFKREWGTFVRVSIIGGLLLYSVGDLSLPLIGAFGAVLFFSHLLAGDAVQKWSEKKLSPGIEGGLTPLYPRVWNFHLSLTEGAPEIRTV